MGNRLQRCFRQQTLCEKANVGDREELDDRLMPRTIDSGSTF